MAARAAFSPACRRSNRCRGYPTGVGFEILLHPPAPLFATQVHILGPDEPCQYWSRKGIDHGQLRHANMPGTPGGFWCGGGREWSGVHCLPPAL